MNTKLKKILIIVIIILIIALAGLLIYQFLLKPSIEKGNGLFGIFPSSKESEIIPGKDSGSTDDGFTPQPERKINAISKEPVLAPTLTNDKNGVIYYSRINGTVWQSNFDGTGLKQLSATSLEDLVKVVWSPDKNSSINIFEDKIGIITKYFYDYSNNKAIPLNKSIKDITWSAENNKIAYQYQNKITDENNISTSNPDGSGYVGVFKTRMRDLIVEWPSGSNIFLREKPSGLAKSSLYSFDIFSKTFIKTITDMYGFSVKWSPDGSKLLYSTTSPGGRNISIYTADRSGTNQKTANINTLAEKCTWTQDPRIIICAIPNNINEAEILPDDFYKGKFIPDDVFWSVNIETGEKKEILDESELIDEIDATDLFLSPEESYLFFINKFDGLLYSIKL